MTSNRFHPTTFVMLVFGLSGCLTGGLLQADVVSFERAFGLNHEELALWLGFFAVLSGVAGGLAGVLSDRFGSGRVFHVSLLFSGIGLLLFVLPSPVAVLIGYIFAGVGIGGLVTGNTVTAEGGFDRPNRSMNLLHASHGLARLAVIPVSIAALASDWRASYALLGIIFVLLALRAPAWPLESRGRADHRFEFSFGSNNRFMLGILAGFFFYMLAELVLVTWLAAYFEEARGWSPSLSRAAYGVYLFGLVAGRLAAARRWPIALPRAGALVLALLHLAGIALFIAVPGRVVALAALFVVGLSQGPGWTALFALAVGRISGRAGQLTSVIYIMTCTGIVVATSGSGVIAHRLGLPSVFIVVAAAHVLFSAIYLALARPRFFSE